MVAKIRPILTTAGPISACRAFLGLSCRHCRSLRRARALRAPGGMKIRAIMLAFALALPVFSKVQAFSIVRDAQTEQLLQEYARPLLHAAQIDPASIRIVLVDDRRFNAFIVDARHIFIHTGVFLDSESPAEIMGVLAHEIGHIKGGHLAHAHSSLDDARFVAMLSALIGVAALATGANANSDSLVGGGAGLAASSGNFGQRLFLAHRRLQEETADRIALQLLGQAGLPTSGLTNILNRLARRERYAGAQADPYLRSHPASSERLRNLTHGAAREKARPAADLTALQQRHDLVRAKIKAYTGRPGSAARAFFPSDKSLAADYGRAILAMRRGEISAARTALDGLVKHAPQNPYFRELLGQLHLQAGNADIAIASFREALQLSPDEPQLRAALGSALLARGRGPDIDEAITLLSRAVTQDQNLPASWRQLAIALNRAGRALEATLATSRSLLASGDIAGAKFHAARVREEATRGDRLWLRADDILALGAAGQSSP